MKERNNGKKGPKEVRKYTSKEGKEGGKKGMVTQGRICPHTRKEEHKEGYKRRRWKEEQRGRKGRHEYILSCFMFFQTWKILVPKTRTFQKGRDP